MSKSKPLLQCYFWSNFVQTFFGWCKITQILCQIFFFLKQIKYGGHFFFICLWNIVKGWSDNYAIFTMYASCHLQKNPKKHKNYPGSPSLWKWVRSLKIEIFVIFTKGIQAKLNELESESGKMGAEGIILAKSLIPNLLRACAIVHCNNKYLNFNIVTTFHETVTTNSYCYIVYSM